MIHQSKSYIKFLRLSKNRHGVHSPFVYNLVTKCFNDKKIYPEYETLKSHRKALRKDASLIEMKDFGQGSRVFKKKCAKGFRRFEKCRNAEETAKIAVPVGALF